VLTVISPTSKIPADSNRLRSVMKTNH